MSGIIVKAGNSIPLHLQLDDFEAGLFCQAVLKDDNGIDFQTVDLVDRGAGLYTNTAVAMPTKNVIAVYHVYNDAGHTMPAERDAGIDLFILDSYIPTRRDDKIFGVIESDQALHCSIIDDPIVAEVDNNELCSAFLPDGGFSGIIQDSDLIAQITRE